jgi:hypothetical protein
MMSSSCKNDEQMVQQVAYAYSYAMANYQVDDAAEYATEETKNTTLIKARSLMKAVGDAYIQSDTPAEIEITDVELTTDTTAIATYHKTTPIKDMTGTLELRKRDGKWLAHIPLTETTLPEKIIYYKDGKEIKETKPLQRQ